MSVRLRSVVLPTQEVWLCEVRYLSGDWDHVGWPSSDNLRCLKMSELRREISITSRSTPGPLDIVWTFMVGSLALISPLCNLLHIGLQMLSTLAALRRRCWGGGSQLSAAEEAGACSTFVVRGRWEEMVLSILTTIYRGEVWRVGVG